MRTSNRLTKLFVFFLLSLGLMAALTSCNLQQAVEEPGAIERTNEECTREELTVNTTEDTFDGVCDSESCSLREAVAQANSCEMEQTVVVPEGTYSLSLAEGEEDNASGGDLDIRNSVTIRAVRGAQPIIDAQNNGRHFEVHSDGQSGGDFEVIFEGLTLRNGQSEFGGGSIRLRNGSLTLQDMLLVNNTAGIPDGPPASGGAVYIVAGSMEVLNSEMSENSSNGSGGAIYVHWDGDLLVSDNSLINLNRSIEDYVGGGIYNRGTARINGDILENLAERLGGGMKNDGEMVVEGARIADNQAGVGGGGIANSGDLRIIDSDVSGNEAPDGGGIYNYVAKGSPKVADISLVGSRITDNRADNGGGGIFNGAGSLLVSTRADLAENNGNRGGGLLNVGESVLIGTSVWGNEAFGAEGGGLWNAGRMAVRESTARGNLVTPDSGPAGSALWNDRGGHVSLRNSTFSGNGVADGTSNTMMNQNGTIVAEYITIADNNGPAIGGPQNMLPAVQIQGSIIARNMAERQCGGAMHSGGANFFPKANCGATSDDIVLADTGEEPGLAALEDNGGPTLTHALQQGSPAVDAAQESCLEQDQRGEARPAGNACDIGAFESEFSQEIDPATIQINFNADRYSIEEGECTTLHWRVTGAETVAVQGDEVEHEAGRETCPESDQIYRLVAENETNQKQSSFEIEVTEPVRDQPEPTPCTPTPENDYCDVPF